MQYSRRSPYQPDCYVQGKLLKELRPCNGNINKIQPGRYCPVHSSISTCAMLDDLSASLHIHQWIYMTNRRQILLREDRFTDAPPFPLSTLSEQQDLLLSFVRSYVGVFMIYNCLKTTTLSDSTNTTILRKSTDMSTHKSTSAVHFILVLLIVFVFVHILVLLVFVLFIIVPVAIVA